MGEFFGGLGNALLPEEFAGGAVVRLEEAFFADGLGDEDAVFADDGCGVAGFGEGGLPCDVVIFGPMSGQVGLRGGTVAQGAAPHGPVCGFSDQARCENKKMQEKKESNGHRESGEKGLEL